MSADQKLDAVLVAKITGFKTTEDADDVSSREILQRLIETADSSAATHGGKLLGSAPSGFAASFESSANAVRFKTGKSELSLERISPDVNSPFRGEIEYLSVGVVAAQERLRSGLMKVPEVTWQYKIKTHSRLGSGNTSYEVEGATSVDLKTAKSLYDEGAVFVETGSVEYWKEQHIPGSVHLPVYRTEASPKTHFTKEKLMAVASPDTKIVISYTPAFGAWDAAKAVVWGYKNVYFFDGGAIAWQEAGYPVESEP